MNVLHQHSSAQHTKRAGHVISANSHADADAYKRAYAKLMPAWHTIECVCIPTLQMELACLLTIAHGLHTCVLWRM